MTNDLVENTIGDIPSPKLVRDQLKEILQSRTFKRSERLRRLLTYLVENTILDPQPMLKEYTIGTDVFGRPESFDPRENPIVRVEARRLRLKLKRYYTHEAEADAVLIDLIRGSYVPVFRTLRDAAKLGCRGAGISLAILPVCCLGRTKQLGFFSRGLMAELAHHLSSAGGVRVLACGSPWTSAEDRKPYQFATRIGADWLLECTTRQQKGRVRVSAQLTRAADGSLHWSYMRDFALGAGITSQEESALAILRGLCAVLSLVPQPRPTSGDVESSRVAHEFPLAETGCLQ